MSISEEEKEQIFHPQPDEGEDEDIFGPASDAGIGYHSKVDAGGNIRLFDDSGVEIPIESVPDFLDPVQTGDDGLSPAQRQWIAQWEQRHQHSHAEEEPPKPSYLQEIRTTKIQCDHCGKVESLETANCLGGAKDDETEEIYAVFGCGCGHTENIPAEDLPPRYIERAAVDENAIEQIIADIKWRQQMGLD